MIKTKADLEGKYAPRSDTEVFELFMDKCEEFGIVWVDTGESPRDISFGDAVEVTRGTLGWLSVEVAKACKMTKLTLADFKQPVKTKAEYTKIEFEKASDAVRAWEDGELYTNASDVSFNKIQTAQDVLRYLYRLHIKTEKEIPWYERLDDFNYPLAVTSPLGMVLLLNSKEDISRSGVSFEGFELSSKAEVQVLLDNAPE